MTTPLFRGRNLFGYGFVLNMLLAFTSRLGNEAQSQHPMRRIGQKSLKFRGPERIVLSIYIFFKLGVNFSRGEIRIAHHSGAMSARKR